MEGGAPYGLSGGAELELKQQQQVQTQSQVWRCTAERHHGPGGAGDIFIWMAELRASQTFKHSYQCLNASH